MYIILAIVLFSVLIFVHELGHFAAAKLLGVRVNEFSLCMGPAIFQKTVGETTYSLRCIPIGGFCAMEGEDEQSGDPRAFTSKAPWRRVIILVAGAFMNLVTGFVILVILFSLSSGYLIKPVISGAYDGCTLLSAEGLQVGDQIYSVNGTRILLYGDVATLLRRGNGETYDLVVLRDGEKVRLDDFAMQPSQFVVNGVPKTMYGLKFTAVEKTFSAGLSTACYTAIDFVRMIQWSLQDILRGAVGIRDFSGPVGIVSLISDTGKESTSVADGMENIFYLGAFLAVNLAVMNMLPIPALDGGRVFCLLLTAIIEKITRKKLNPKYEGYVHATGMVLLLSFMAVVTISDVVKLIVS
ncbi:MAG: M50 family metallopeptidase [Oscillospiraceae bacterium]|nr:M50 family metallopeptidase [Oscillospiraceae bacterium]